MIRFAKAAWPQAARSNEARVAAFLCAGLFLLMAVTQLFSFEKTLMWWQDLGSAGDVFASVVIVATVFALPFLLSMKLSALARVCSMLCGWLVVAIWLSVSITLATGALYAEQLFLFGDSIPLPIGWWAVCFFVGVGSLVAWASWGLWPLRTQKHTA